MARPQTAYSGIGQFNVRMTALQMAVVGATGVVSTVTTHRRSRGASSVTPRIFAMSAA